VLRALRFGPALHIKPSLRLGPSLRSEPFAFRALLEGPREAVALRGERTQLLHYCEKSPSFSLWSNFLPLKPVEMVGPFRLPLGKYAD